MNVAEAMIEAGTGLRLTRREGEVLRHLHDGCSDHEIADVLGISPDTVRAHLQALSHKLGVQRRMRIIAEGRRWASSEALGRTPPAFAHDGSAKVAGPSWGHSWHESEHRWNGDSHRSKTRESMPP
jgi:DNA-binding CsgD family transcriptional regulator